MGWMGMTGGGCGGWIPAPSSRVRAIRGKNGCRDGFLREGDDAGREGLMRFDGEGQPQGLPLRGTDVVVVVERVRQFGWGVPEPPLRRKVGDGG